MYIYILKDVERDCKENLQLFPIPSVISKMTRQLEKERVAVAALLPDFIFIFPSRSPFTPFTPPTGYTISGY